jgi:hypothetical protein
MPPSNGESEEARGPLELSETLYIERSDGARLPFEVVGILQDADDGTSYAVLRHGSEEEEDDEFIVTTLEGELLGDDGLAQEILDDFLAFAEGIDDGRSARNGETS